MRLREWTPYDLVSGAGTTGRRVWMAQSWRQVWPCKWRTMLSVKVEGSDWRIPGLLGMHVEWIRDLCHSDLQVLATGFFGEDAALNRPGKLPGDNCSRIHHWDCCNSIW